MSLAGLKKQFNKANQYFNEKVLSAEGTPLDDEFADMEMKSDAFSKLIEEILLNIEDYLQPNPALRAKLAAVGAMSKIGGGVKESQYIHPETTIGDSMIKHGKTIGSDNSLGESCVEVGESFKQLGDLKHSLEENTRQNFILPLIQIQSKEMKEIGHHRKKLWGRRLDYDCKRRKQKGGTDYKDGDIKVAEDKLEESKSLAETAMYNLLENDVEHISQLLTLVESQLNFHRQAVDILQHTESLLKTKRDEASSKTRSEHVAKKVFSADSNNHLQPGSGTGSKSSRNGLGGSSPAHTPTGGSGKYGKCRALYDFDGQNTGELTFTEGDLMEIRSQADDNWFEGKLVGKDEIGYFPINYVEVTVPLPR